VSRCSLLPPPPARHALPAKPFWLACTRRWQPPPTEHWHFALSRLPWALLLCPVRPAAGSSIALNQLPPESVARIFPVRSNTLQYTTPPPAPSPPVLLAPPFQVCGVHVRVGGLGLGGAGKREARYWEGWEAGGSQRAAAGIKVRAVFELSISPPPPTPAAAIALVVSSCRRPCRRAPAFAPAASALPGTCTAAAAPRTGSAPQVSPCFLLASWPKASRWPCFLPVPSGLIWPVWAILGCVCIVFRVSQPLAS
jgi:hypothetical protein